MSELYFVGGAHGSGKSSISNLIARSFNFDVATASELIRNSGVMPSTADKRVSGIPHNQQVLLDSLAIYRRRDVPIVLDGHFCLFNEMKVPVEIDLRIFEAIGPTAIILVTAALEEIVERISLRDGLEHNAEEIYRLCQCEFALANRVSESLSIPLLVVDAHTDPMDIVHFIEQFYPTK